MEGGRAGCLEQFELSLCTLLGRASRVLAGLGGGRRSVTDRGGGTEVPVDLSTVGSYRPPVDLGNNL